MGLFKAIQVIYLNLTINNHRQSTIQTQTNIEICRVI